MDEKDASDRWAKRWLEHGTGVTLVMSRPNQKKINEMMKDYPWIVNGDLTDFRFADPPSAFVTLHNKGAAGCANNEGKTLIRNREQINEYLRLVAKIQGSRTIPQLPAPRTKRKRGKGAAPTRRSKRA